MSSETFSCPGCGAMLQYIAGLAAGAAVQCPKCQAKFAAPDRGTAGAPGDEFTASPIPSAPRTPPADWQDYGPRGRRAADWQDDYPDADYADGPQFGRYSIDIGRWFGLAGENYSALLGASIGFILLAALVSVIPYMLLLGAAVFVARRVADNDLQGMLVTQALAAGAQLILMPVLFFPLWSGMTAVNLAQIRGQRWSFADFFAGFQRFGALAGVGLASQLLTLATVSIPQLAVVFAAFQSEDPSMLHLVPVVTLAGMAVLVFFEIRLLLFAPAIIFDRNLSAVDAIKANWELTRGHFWGLFGVSLLLGLILFAGVLACGIGLLFAFPFAMLVLTAGYVLITQRRPSPDYEFHRDY
ncbi:MAG TPA: hypothetical protein VMS17_15480 [Gemmataceae bacterium]|nr:hypothetical protein [Gemmataceae bacterium]